MSKIWQKNLNKLIRFKTEFGHTNVPKSYVDQKLARLVTTLRQQKRYGTLNPERELALHQIGFDFEPLQSQWIRTYDKVVEYYKISGHTYPNRRSKNEYERALAEWVYRMHKLIRSNELTKEKIEKLNLINIDGYPSNCKINRNGLPEGFQKMFDKLTNYIQTHSSVISLETADPSLHSWASLQQQRINLSLISPKEYVSLIKTGFYVEDESVSCLRMVSNHE